MLEVQKYLRSGKTLEDLASDYVIKANVDDELGIVSLNYNQFAGMHREPIVRECRGLILELGTWNVVFKSFTRFYNYGEPWADEIDWNSATYTPKLDGSLIGLYWYKGQWRVCTSSIPQANHPGVDGRTYRDLVLLTLKDMGYTSFEDFTSMFLSTFFYTFELTAPENRVVVNHHERKMTLLTAIENDPETGFAEVPPFSRHTIKRYDYVVSKPVPDDLEGFLTAINGLNPDTDEGIVIRDKYDRRLKVKSEAYVMAHRMVDNATTRVISLKNRLEVILSGRMDDVLSVVAPVLKDILLADYRDVQGLLQRTKDIYATVASIPVQKDFAAAVKGYDDIALLFSMRNGQTAEEAYSTMLRTGALELLRKYKQSIGESEEPTIQIEEEDQ